MPDSHVLIYGRVVGLRPHGSHEQKACMLVVSGSASVASLSRETRDATEVDLEDGSPRLRILA